MGRAGRYTLSVMAWIAAFAGWSSIIGLVVAAVTGGEADQGVSAGTSALFYVLGPLVPTLVALWFNDWARDGFPTREQRREQARRKAAPVEAATTPPEAATAPPAAPAAPAAPPRADAPRTEPARVEAAPVEAVVPDGGAPAFVAATPLGVPEPKQAEPVAGGFPVAPLVRDRLDVDGD